MRKLKVFHHAELGLVTVDRAREIVQDDWRRRNNGWRDGTRNSNPYRRAIRAAVDVLRRAARHESPDRVF